MTRPRSTTLNAGSLQPSRIEQVAILLLGLFGLTAGRHVIPLTKRWLNHLTKKKHEDMFILGLIF